MRKILKWAGIVFAVLVVVFFGWRVVVVVGKQKTEEAVQKIHNTKLTLADVLGDNLPVPSEVEGPPDYNATVAGVDKNKNGIRDDVELAIFAEYPNSARTRAVLLQYALALQMEVTQPIVNEGTVIAVAQSGDRALNCIWSISSRADRNKFREETTKNEEFVKSYQLNTKERENAQTDFYKGNLGSYSSPNEECDIDLSTLPN